MSNSWIGIAAGAGAALLAGAIMPAAVGGLKVVTKTVIKGGLMAYAGGMTLIDQTTHAIENIATEAKAELKGNDRKQTPSKKSMPKTAQKKKQARSAEKTTSAKPSE